VSAHAGSWSYAIALPRGRGLFTSAVGSGCQGCSIGSSGNGAGGKGFPDGSCSPPDIQSRRESEEPSPSAGSAIAYDQLQRAADTVVASFPACKLNKVPNKPGARTLGR